MDEIASQIIGRALTPDITPAPRPNGAAPQDKPDPLRTSAEALEASFLAEMLKHTGVGKMPESFNGGPGEAAFSDFLVHEYAGTIASTRSIGLADHIYRALSERALK